MSGVVGRRVRVKGRRGVFVLTNVHSPFKGSTEIRYHVERRTSSATLSFSVPRSDLKFVKGDYRPK